MSGVPTIDPAELVPGDVLLFRGSHPLSAVIRIVDDCEYDHVGVAGRSQHGQGIEVMDIGFDGPRRFLLPDYEDRPARVLVRRHRIDGWREPFLRNTKLVHDSTRGYAYDRLMAIILISLTRFSSSMANLDPETARNFAGKLHRLFNMTHAPQDPARPDRVCVDLVTEGFDIFASTDAGSAGQQAHLGMVLPRHALGGMLRWVASARELGEYIDRTVDMMGSRRSEGHDVPEERARQAMQALHALYGALGVTFPSSDLSESAVREAVLSSAWTLALRLGAPLGPPPDASEMTDAYPLWAWRLLDEILQRRFVVTPRDMHESLSLYDVGVFELP